MTDIKFYSAHTDSQSCLLAHEFTFCEKISVNDIKTYQGEANAVYYVPTQKLINKSDYKNIIKFLKCNNTNKLLVNDDFHYDITNLVLSFKTLLQYDVSLKNVFIVFDFHHQLIEFEALCSKHNILGIQCFVYNFWLKTMHKLMLPIQEKLEELKPEKRFSLLSRRYDDLRFKFILKLLDNGILNDTFYTFTHLDVENLPYPHECLQKSDLIILAESYGYRDENIIDWINKLPYVLDQTKLIDPYALETFYPIKKSYINIIIESNNPPVQVDVSPSFSRVFTEKTFKTILMKKPFLFYGPQGALEFLKQDGFKTFNSFIDETYDNIGIDFDHRTTIICNELQKINRLNDFDFNKLNDDLSELAEHNYKSALTKVKIYDHMVENLKKKIGLK